MNIFDWTETRQNTTIFSSGGIDVSKHSKERWRKLGVHNHEPTPSPKEDESTTQRFNKVALHTNLQLV